MGGARVTQAEFIKRSVAAHGDRYDYSKSVFTRMNDKVTIVCPVHGEFSQVARAHIDGFGCKLCADDARRGTASKLIERSRELYGDRFSYDKVVYITARLPVVITCKVHGDFLVTPDNHMNNDGGCRLCSANKKRSGRSTFIAAATARHGDRYDYKEVVYKTSGTKVIVTCREHGDFSIAPNKHLVGRGCPECGTAAAALLNTIDTGEFIRRSRLVHGDKYDYNRTIYSSYNEPVEIACSVHGVFTQIADYHIRGRGCKQCGNQMSRAEADISSFLEEFYEVRRGDRKILNGLEVDILVPEKNFGIEYNGSYWHSEAIHKDPKNHMVMKQKGCMSKGVRLIHVSDSEDLVVVKKTLAHVLGIDDEKYYARKCELRTGRSNDPLIKEFLTANHLQGGVSGCWVSYLTMNGAIVCVAAFSRASSERGNSDKNRWELRRFSSCCRVVGGASRLLKAFIRNHPDCTAIISYSDNRWFTGNVYEQLGFEFIHDVRPDYKYVKGHTTLPKGRFKHSCMRTRNDIDYNPLETEVENANRNGWWRIWDCGKKKWELTL